MVKNAHRQGQMVNPGRTSTKRRKKFRSKKENVSWRRKVTPLTTPPTQARRSSGGVLRGKKRLAGLGRGMENKTADIREIKIDSITKVSCKHL